MHLFSFPFSWLICPFRGHVEGGACPRCMWVKAVYTQLITGPHETIWGFKPLLKGTSAAPPSFAHTRAWTVNAANRYLQPSSKFKGKYLLQNWNNNGLKYNFLNVHDTDGINCVDSIASNCLLGVYVRETEIRKEQMEMSSFPHFLPSEDPKESASEIIQSRWCASIN